MRDFDPSTLGPRSSLWRGIKGEVNPHLGRGKVEDIEVIDFPTRHEPLARRISLPMLYLSGVSWGLKIVLKIFCASCWCLLMLVSVGI